MKQSHRLKQHAIEIDIIERDNHMIIFLGRIDVALKSTILKISKNCITSRGFIKIKKWQVK
jgi:hypothetical protein